MLTTLEMAGGKVPHKFWAPPGKRLPSHAWRQSAFICCLDSGLVLKSCY